MMQGRQGKSDRSQILIKSLPLSLSSYKRVWDSWHRDSSCIYQSTHCVPESAPGLFKLQTGWGKEGLGLGKLPAEVTQQVSDRARSDNLTSQPVPAPSHDHRGRLPEFFFPSPANFLVLTFPVLLLGEPFPLITATAVPGITLGPQATSTPAHPWAESRLR